MSDLNDRIASYLSELLKAQEQLTEKEFGSGSAIPKYPGQASLSLRNTQKFARISKVDLENWAVLVQPLMVNNDGSRFVLHQNPAIPGFTAYLPSNAPHPLVGDNAIVTYHGEVMNGTGDTQLIHSATPIAAPCIPLFVVERLGHFDLRTDNETTNYSNPFVNQLTVRSPQVYRALAYTKGFDLGEYQEVAVIQLCLATRDTIPDASLLMGFRGPVTRGSYVTLDENLEETDRVDFSSGIYIQAPFWM